MKKIFTLALGVLTTVGALFAQKTPQTPQSFPQAIQEQNSSVHPVEYSQKYFVLSINSINSGNWNQPGTWDCGCVPTFQDNVNIQPTHEITVNQDINVSSIFIDSTATLNTTDAGVVDINLSGDWINNGQFIAHNSKVIFSGYDDQSISGMTTFNVLSILHDRQVNILSPVTVLEQLKLSDATLNTNDQLTFGYSNGKSAELYRVLTGTIVGDIIAESSIELNSGTWFATASPVSNATLSQWNDDFVTTGFTGSDYPNYNFNNISYFTEQMGYVFANDINDEIIPGAGYFIYENAGIHPYEVQGNPTVGEFSFPITYTDSLPTENRGWNLLGNPYLATINWDNQSGWNKDNIGRALYLWDENTQAYKVYMNGYTINGGSPIIKPFDNFFVATQANPTLTINELAKQNGEYVQGFPQANYFKFRVSGESSSDEMIVVLDDNASSDYQIANDAIRNFNDINTEISTVSSDGQNLCINSLPIIDSGMDIPVVINSPLGGTFTLDILDIPAGLNSCLALENLQTNEIYNLQETSTLTFTINPTAAEEVFVLHIGGSVTGAKIDASCHGLSDGSITATGSGDGFWDYYWYDQDNNLIESDLGTDDSSTLDSLAAGVYTLVIGNLDFCPSLTQTVTVEEPEALMLDADITQPTCNVLNSGEIASMVSGGNQNYSYAWSNGAETENITNLAGGTYSLTVTDAHGCEVSESYQIEDATIFDANFDIASITPQAGGLNEVVFNNTSENADSFLWEFGDGVSATIENPTHTYSQPGEYVVTLTVTQGECSMSYNYVLQIGESTVGIDELTTTEDIVVANNNGNYSLIFNYSSIQEVKISIHNLLGQELTSTTAQVKRENYKLDLPQGKNQILFVAITNKNNQEKKVFKLIQK